MISLHTRNMLKKFLGGLRFWRRCCWGWRVHGVHSVDHEATRRPTWMPIEGSRGHYTSYDAESGFEYNHD